MTQPSPTPDAPAVPPEHAVPAVAALPLFRRGAWGRLAVSLLPLVAVSGLVLAFFYRPSVDGAWWSVAAIRGSDWGVVRDLHRWGGELLLIAAWLHLFRVFMVGAYRRLPGWTVSVAGTIFVVLSMATGWLLRHDAGAALAGRSLGLGIPVVYALHVLVLPLAFGWVVVTWRRSWKKRASSDEAVAVDEE